MQYINNRLNNFLKELLRTVPQMPLWSPHLKLKFQVLSWNFKTKSRERSVGWSSYCSGVISYFLYPECLALFWGISEKFLHTKSGSKCYLSSQSTFTFGYYCFNSNLHVSFCLLFPQQICYKFVPISLSDYWVTNASQLFAFIHTPSPINCETTLHVKLPRITQSTPTY